MKNTYHHLAKLFILAVFINACNGTNNRPNEETSSLTSIFTNDKFDIEKVQAILKQKIESNSLTFYNKTDSSVKDFQEFYAQKNYQPIWVNEKGISKRSQQFLSVLDSLKYDALNPEKYHLTSLRNELKNIENSNSPDSVVQFELNMTNAFFGAISDITLGAKRFQNDNKEWKSKNDSIFNKVLVLKSCIDSLSPSEVFENLRPNHPWYKKFKEEYSKLLSKNDVYSMSSVHDLTDSMAIGFTSPSIVLLRKKIFHEVGLPVDTISKEWKEDLLEGVKKFQFANQLKTTGKIDSSTLQALSSDADDKMKKLALNMERMRWLKHEFPQPFIWVNIPKMELDYYDKDSVEFNMRVVVGRTSRQTPTLDAKVENVVFSPPWSVPPTIMKEEVVPGIARRGGSYLSRRGLKAYDSRGRVVNPASINANNFKRFNISQAPGYRSSLGEVKFNMPNPWAIYLHDTPHREDFVKSYRAYSSGCIRVQKPKQFAEFLLQDTSLYSYSKIDSICKMRKTIFVPVKKNIDVHIVYLTNGIDSLGNIMYLKDVYGWDKNMN